MNCEAGSLYPHRARLEEVQMQTCFNDYHDLMVAARIGKDGYIRQIAGYCTDENDTRVRQVSWAICEVSWGKTKHRETEKIEDLTRARMTMTRVCVFITLDRSMHQTHLVLLVNAQLLWLSSVPSIKLMSSQVMETRHATTPHQNLQVFPHINAAYYNSGLTE